MHASLLSSCARAATVAEARYRIDRPIGGRAALVIALDDGAAEVVNRTAELPWQGARFVRTDGTVPSELGDSDVAIMIATGAADAGAAATIAAAASELGIMCSGLVLGERAEVLPTLAALRPYARNLMATTDEDDVAAVLTALRA